MPSRRTAFFAFPFDGSSPKPLSANNRRCVMFSLLVKDCKSRDWALGVTPGSDSIATTDAPASACCHSYAESEHAPPTQVSAVAFLQHSAMKTSRQSRSTYITMSSRSKYHLPDATERLSKWFPWERVNPRIFHKLIILVTRQPLASGKVISFHVAPPIRTPVTPGIMSSYSACSVIKCIELLTQRKNAILTSGAWQRAIMTGIKIQFVKEMLPN